MRRSVGLALVLMLLFAVPAGATFPGRNGDLLVTTVGNDKYQDQRTTLVRIDPRSGRLHRLPICAAVEWAQHGQPPLCSRAGPPAVSPDGRRVAVVSLDRLSPLPADPPTWNLRVISLEDGSQAHTTLSGPTPLLPPIQPIVRWSADAASVLLLEPLGAATDWWAPPPGRAVLAGLGGGEREELASGVSSPDLAADGRLAFVRSGDVFVQAPGRKARRIARRGDRPAWSPHGRFVAFSRDRQVFVVGAGGGRARRVARGSSPVWSPDGRQIAFVRRLQISDPGFDPMWEAHVFTLTRRTGRVRRVIPTDFGIGPDHPEDVGLDWQPLPPKP